MAHHHRVITDYTQNLTENAHVKVFVRARPPDENEELCHEAIEVDGKKITIRQMREEWGGVGGNSFAFDGIFWCESQQEEIFQGICKEQVDHVLNGYNACAFAYGQTGSGKTHSMFFPGGGRDRQELDTMGIIPRAVNYLFSRLPESAELHVSFLEIYCDTLRDLGKVSLDTKTSEIYRTAAQKRAETFGSRGKFANSALSPTFSNTDAFSFTNTMIGGLSAVSMNPTTPVTTLNPNTQNDHNECPESSNTNTKTVHFDLGEEIREDAAGNVFVKGLARIPVKTCKEVMDVLDRGLKVRATEATTMNDTSSRSHTVFTIEVAVHNSQGGLRGKLHLVDLAGSERLKKSESSGIRLKEALHINKSLTALGKVIVALDPHDTGSHIPYRDSKLTRLLQNALGGDSFTTVLATIRPTRQHAEECLSTLQFANRCRRVANHPRVHRLQTENSNTSNHRLTAALEQIRRLQNQVNHLKQQRTQLLQKLALATGQPLEDLKAEWGLPFTNGEDDDDDDLDDDHAKAVHDTNGTADTQDQTKNNPTSNDLDPAAVQGVVSHAVLAALKAAGIDGAVFDEKTGGIALNDGNLIESTLPTAFAGLTKQARQRQSSLRTSGFYKQRGSMGTLALASRVARIFGWSPYAVPPALIDVLADREKEFQDAKHKNDQLKLHLETLKTSLDDMKSQADKDAFQHNSKVKSSEQEIDRILKQCAEEQKAAVDEKQREINSILAAIRQQQDFMSRPTQRIRDSERTISALKQQYEHWLAQKDKQCHDFIAQLNDYRERKRHRLDAAETELQVLWRSVTELNDIIHKIKSGSFPLVQLPNHVTAPRLPRLSALPKLNDLPATKRALHKKNPRQQCQKITQGATDTAPTPEIEEELQRTKTHLSLLESKFESQLEARLDARLKAELSAHPTVSYVQDLEARLVAAEKRASAQTKSHADLRVAYLHTQQRPATANGRHLSNTSVH